MYLPLIDNPYHPQYNTYMKVPIKFFGGKAPERQTEGSAGYDLFAAKPVVIKPKSVEIVHLGFSIAIPQGYEAQIRSRSGIARKNKLFVLNSPGTIDSDHRDEVCVLLMNLGDEDFVVEENMRVAQMIFAKVENVKFETVAELDATARGPGWGSTGL